jgi:hypothetical protein
MKSFSRKQASLIGIALVVLTGGFLLVKNAEMQSLTKQGSQEPDPVMLALRKGGLREAAKLKGHYVGIERTSDWGKYSLNSLTQASSYIVVGSPILSSAKVVGTDKDRIVTEHLVRVDQLLKGKLHENTLITVAIPGGKVTFEDGTSAEIKTPDFGPIEEFGNYVLFLSPSNDTANVFVLTGAGQGLFELSSESLVKPRGNKADTVQKHKNQKISLFLEQIRKIVEKNPVE